MITEYGLMKWMTGPVAGRYYAASPIDSIKIGTGTAAPTTSTTALSNVVKTDGISIGGVCRLNPAGDGIIIPYKVITSSAGLVGLSLSEVGLYSGTDCCVAALIEDSEGDPVAVTMLDGDTLEILIEFEIVFNTTPTTGTITIAGIDYNWSLVLQAPTVANNFNFSWGRWDTADTALGNTFDSPTVTECVIPFSVGYTSSNNQTVGQKTWQYSVGYVNGSGYNAPTYSFIGSYKIMEFTISRVSDSNIGLIRAVNESLSISNLVTLTAARI